MNIPFNKSYFTGKEISYVEQCFVKNKLLGDGFYTKQVSEFIEKTFNTKKALLTTSCSSALDMTAILINLQPGDEVIMPSYTFVSTANAVVLRGATPVFAEIDERTLNIDPKDIENRITERTKAIFPVHYAGISCDMDTIMKIAKKYGLKVVEDAAQGVNARYKDKYLGTIGDIGCYSFHETKNYSCGEGGAILINHNDDLIEKAEIIREKGTNRSKFFRGEVDKYSWVSMGSSFLPSDILAALLYAQFEKLIEINDLREKVFKKYYNGLKPLQEEGILRLPIVLPDCTSNYHMFYILLNSEIERNNLMDSLKAKGVQALFHYVPLHSSPMGIKLGYKEGDLPKTEDLSKRLLRLPVYADLTEQEQNYIIKNIYKILGY